MSLPIPNPFDSTVAGLRRSVATLGAVFDPGVLAATRDLYRGHIPPAGSGGVRAVKDIPWGPHPRQALDLYMPPGVSDAPVLVFLHGGGFVAGGRAEDDAFHRNVGEYFARHGFLTLVPSYRLAPDDPWPAGARDVGGVLAWAHEKVAQYGGDPAAIVAVAQSAGASHAATWLFDEEVRDGQAPPLRAVALLSGFYRATPPLSPSALSYFGADEAQYARRSVAARVHGGHPPLLLTVAELDPGGMAAQTLDLARQLALCDGRPPRIVWLEGHNHVSPVLSLGSPQDDVGRMLLAFLRGSLSPAAH